MFFPLGEAQFRQSFYEDVEPLRVSILRCHIGQRRQRFGLGVAHLDDRHQSEPEQNSTVL